MRHIKALSKVSMPALAGVPASPSSCLDYLLQGDLSTFKECKVDKNH